MNYLEAKHSNDWWDDNHDIRYCDLCSKRLDLDLIDYIKLSSGEVVCNKCEKDVNCE